MTARIRADATQRADTLVRYATALRESRTVGQMDTVFGPLRRAMEERP